MHKNTHIEYHINEDKTKFVNETNSSEYTLDAVRTYLAGAYYKITKDITLESGYAGLGAVNSAYTNYECPYAFRGVLFSDPGYTVTNTSANPLVVNSNGCVIRNLTVELDAEVSLTVNKVSDNKTLVFKYLREAGGIQEYGAVIGRVMGGDTFIDNVGVRFGNDASISLSGSAARLIPVGGYIGAAVNGAVIFRNMASADRAGLTDDVCSAVDNNGYLYVNPIIGRVLSGFAFSESEKMANGNKNYDIPQLDPDSTADKLEVTSDTVTVNGPQSLWVLAAIVNSGAGAAASAGAKYDTISATYAYWQGWRNYCTAREGDTEDYLADHSISGDSRCLTPYIISAYTKDAGSRSNARTIGGKSNWDVVFAADCDLSDYGGFRGIGNFYIDSEKLTIRADNIYGKNGTPHLIGHNTRYLEYDIVNENYQAFENAALALLNNMKQAANIHDLYIGGTVIYDKYNAANGNPISGKNNTTTSGTGAWSNDADFAGDKAKRALSVGGLIGLNNYDGLTISNVQIKGELSIQSARYAGGLIGISNNSFTITDCGSFDEDGVLTIRAAYAAGGLAGRCCGSNKTIEITGGPSNIYVNAIGTLSRQTGNLALDFQGGGVVGYAGAGDGDKANTNTITIKKMTVIGGDIRTDVTNGDTKADIGGIIGGTYREKETTVEDCHIKNVSIAGIRGGGGIIGKANQGVTIRNVSVINDTDGEKKIEAITSAGGIIGKLDSCAATIENAEISAYTITSSTRNNADASAGGVVGYSYNSGNNTVINNITVSQCMVYAKSNKGAAGGLVGYDDAKLLSGYNILVDSLTASDTNGNPGVLAGTNNSKLIKLVGVSVQDAANGNLVGSGNYGSGGYVIFADYMGVTTGSGMNEDNSCLYASGTDRAAAAPYVTVNPAAAIDDEQILTGDGMAASAGALVINSILGDLEPGADTAGRFPHSYAAAASGIATEFDSGLFSTYQTEDGGSGDDFAVMLFDTSNDNDDIHVILNSYLDYLTDTQYNFGADTANVYTVSIYRMEKDGNGVFRKYNTQQRLTRVNSKFALTSQFDSGRDSFTLIDVAFRDPADTSKTAYHLYVPVYVRKVLNFGFTARVLSGTDYRSADYPGSAIECAENLGTPVTLCLTYTYGRPAVEEALEGAGGDTGSYDKRLIFRSDLAQTLDPTKTKLVLVDKQTNRAYYATLEDATEDEAGYIDFSKFADSNGAPFENRTFEELAEASPAGDLTEVYYLSVFADKPAGDEDENWISKYTVDCEKKLIGTSDGVPAVFSQSSSVRSYSELYLGNIYTVTAALETNLNGDTGNEQRKVVSLGRNTITAELSSGIWLDNIVAAERTQEMHQSFLVYLKRTESDGQSETGLLSYPTVRAWYSTDGSEPTAPYPNEDIIVRNEFIELRLPSSVTISADAKTIKARVELTYNDENDISGQFPPMPEQSDGSGTVLFIKSNIATAAEQAAYSGISQTGEDSSGISYFGSIAVKQAKFSYDPIILDQGGALSDLSDLKELGINPKDTGDNLQTEELTHLTVHTIAILNYEDVAAQCGDYAYLQLTLKLSRKGSYGVFLPLNTYLNSLSVGGHAETLTNGTSITVKIPRADAAGTGYTAFEDAYNTASVPIFLDVITGAPFEQAGLEYSNYRVTVTANLLDEDERSLLSGLALEKYIIYTNAKIIPDFIS